VATITNINNVITSTLSSIGITSVRTGSATVVTAGSLCSASNI
jgi:hypothetical protein